MEPEDLEELYQIENDANEWEVGATNVPYSRFSLQNFIAQTTYDIYADKQVRLICENAEGYVVGIVDIMNFDPRHMRAEVGIIIRPRYRGQGYGLAALQHIHAYSRKVLSLHQLYAIVASDNTPSIRLFTKAGYQATATLRDWLLYDGKYQSAVVMQTFL